MITAANLTRTFGFVRRKTAVNAVSFEVAPGEVFGFLGHNGAGKTTTVRMLTGQLRPSAGSGTIAGFDIVRERKKIHPIIGVVFDEQNLYEKMTGRANLRLFADLYGVPHTRADELLELVGLAGRSRDKVKKYSNGMKQRLLIARALLNRPRVLFLDEPSRGLDPTSAREIRRLIQQLALEGTTVFLTTHYMEEADQLCGRVAFISEGQIIALDTPRNLKLKFGSRRAQVVLTPPQGSASPPEPREIALDDPAAAAALETWMAQGRVQTIHSQEATLEEVFIHLAGRSLE
jgi:ABC-2 type transport system ATP-binding protein